MKTGLRLTEEEFAALARKSARPVECSFSPTPGQPNERSRLELALALQLDAEGMRYQREFGFCDRRWRIDFAFPEERLAVEVQGAVHRIKTRFKSDIAKVQRLTLMGWHYLPIGSDDIRSGRAVDLIRRALTAGEHHGAVLSHPPCGGSRPSAG